MHVVENPRLYRDRDQNIVPDGAQGTLPEGFQASKGVLLHAAMLLLGKRCLSFFRYAPKV